MDGMPDMPVNVPVDDPNADTEWNDILRKHKIIPEKPPSPTPMIEEALTQARQLAHENRLEGKDLDELDELEDDEDDAFLDHYRQKRMAELNTIQFASKYNQVYPITKADWTRDVTDASGEAFVFVLLTSSSGMNTESEIMVRLWRELASRWGDVKFCQIRGDLAIEGYPDRNTPTILVYKDADVRRTVVTLKELKGASTSLEDVESMMIELGTITRQDPRFKRKQDANADDGGERRGIRQGKSGRGNDDEEDSDWD